MNWMQAQHKLYAIQYQTTLRFLIAHGPIKLYYLVIMQVKKVLYNECYPSNSHHQPTKRKPNSKNSHRLVPSRDNQCLRNSRSSSLRKHSKSASVRKHSKSTSQRKHSKSKSTVRRRQVARNPLYSSPASKSNRKKKSKKSRSRSPIADWTLKIPYPIREKENKPLGSTRIPNERSTMTDRTFKQAVKSSKTKVHPKARPKKRKEKKENVQKHQNQKLSAKKTKKAITAIQTQFSQRRKQSYFDEMILKQLRGGSVGRGRYAESQMINQVQKFSGNRDGTTFLPNRSKIESYRDFGTQTDSFNKEQSRQPLDRPGCDLELEIERVESFRKEQQLKWRIMHLGLQNFKMERKTETLQQMERQSEQNLHEVQTQSKKLHAINNLAFEVIESPKIVQKALRNVEAKRSVSQVSQIVRTLSNNKLLHELELAEEIEQLKIMKDSSEPQGNSKYSSSSIFCVEFEKQMEDFVREEHESPGQVANCNLQKQIFCQQQARFTYKTDEALKVQSERGERVYEAVFHSLCTEYCKEIWEHAAIFHSFMQAVRVSEQPMCGISASNADSLELVTGFFNFILQNPRLETDILLRLNIPYGKSSELLLKQIQNMYKDNEEEGIDVGLYEAPPEIISAQILGEYDVQTYTVPSEDQYFYNHCVYGCLNQLLDQHRPYGLNGVPPLAMQIPETLIVRNLKNVLAKVLNQFVAMIDVRMGRVNFSAHEDCIVETEKVYDRMDRYFVAEEELKWKYLQNILENQLFLSLVVYDQIINEEVMIIYTQLN